METMTVTKMLTLVFAIYSQVLYLNKVSSPSSGRKNVMNNQNFQFFFLTTLRTTCCNKFGAIGPIKSEPHDLQALD